MATIFLSRRFPLQFRSVVSSRIRFNYPHSCFFTNLTTEEADARLSASENLKRVLESKIRRVKIFPDRKDCPFKRVYHSDDDHHIIVLKGKIMGQQITITGYDHIWGHYEEEDGEIDYAKIDVNNSHIEKYTSNITLEIVEGNGRYIDFLFDAFTGINKLRCVGTSVGCYQGSKKIESDVKKTDMTGMTTEIEKDPEKWLAARGIVCDISLAYMVEEQMKNDRRHYLISWMKKLKDFTTT